MYQPTPADLKEIAEQLSMGFKAFVHKENGELLFFPDERQFWGEDFSAWKKEMDKLENNPDEYLEIDKWTSYDAYRIMADFAEQVTNSSLKNKLVEALNKRKPFQGFRFIVDNDFDLREDWFVFRDKGQQEYVRKQFYADSEEMD